LQSEATQRCGLERTEVYEIRVTTAVGGAATEAGYSAAARVTGSCVCCCDYQLTGAYDDDRCCSVCGYVAGVSYYICSLLTVS